MNPNRNSFEQLVKRGDTQFKMLQKAAEKDRSHGMLLDWGRDHEGKLRSACERAAWWAYRQNMPEGDQVEIEDAKRLAKQLDLQAVVVLTVARDGTVKVVSYGETKAKCKSIGDWAQGLWKYAVTINPFQTVFGWGHGGKPKK